MFAQEKASGKRAIIRGFLFLFLLSREATDNDRQLIQQVVSSHTGMIRRSSSHESIKPIGNGAGAAARSNNLLT